MVAEQQQQQQQQAGADPGQAVLCGDRAQRPSCEGHEALLDPRPVVEQAGRLLTGGERGRTGLEGAQLGSGHPRTGEMVQRPA
jgi:hypothetical protein